MRRFAALLAGLLALGACGPTASPEQADANQEILAGIRDRLAGEPGVVEVTADYVDDVDTDARAAVSVECDGCDVPAVYDTALREIWSSEVTPLREISVRVNDPTSARSRVEVLSVAAEEAALVERYGERAAP